uniref:Lupus La protein homolog n=1 Tax=Phallusia mammillata TaxID=59560 RepID=A0A6F9DUB3_9ASCI|nr:lupus La protein homolog [Phallusia mammillata]
MVSADGGINDLEKKLIRQVEFYFGDFNLHRDKFMQNEMKSNDGWFSMETMLKFQRLASICSEPGTILAALKKSKRKLLEIDLEGQKIRRKPSKPVPENSANYRRQLDQRTVYVKGFPQTDTIEQITEFLEDYGEIDGVQLRRFNNKHMGSVFKGSLYATFNKLEEAEKFLQAPMVYYKDKEVEKMSKADFLKEKEKENAEMRPQRRKKSQESKDGVQTEEKEEEKAEQEEVYSFIHVSNLTDETINHIDVKDLFQEIGAPSVKFFSRYEKDGPTGYALFTTENAAEETLKLLTMNKNGCIVPIKSSEVKFEAISEEDQAKAMECYSEFRNKNNRDKKFRKFGGGKRRRGNQRQHTKYRDESNGEPKAKQVKAEE